MKYYLVKVGLDQLWVHLLVLWDVGVQELPQVHGQVFEDEVDLCILYHPILSLIYILSRIKRDDYKLDLQSHDVGVLQLLEDGDLPDGGAGHTLVL